MRSLASAKNEGVFVDPRVIVIWVTPDSMVRSLGALRQPRDDSAFIALYVVLGLARCPISPRN
jgi:hypothetical protein